MSGRATGEIALSLTEEEFVILLDIVATHDNIGPIGEDIYERMLRLDASRTIAATHSRQRAVRRP